MSRRQPIELVVTNGKKHITKAEIEERLKSEIHAPKNNITPPNYLPENLKEEFSRIADELININIMSNLDNEALARFIISEHQYQEVTTKLLKLKTVGKKYYDLILLQEKLFKMVRQSANDLGLSISSRCKLVVPQKEEKQESKWSKFGVSQGG
jgi:P27 family predicted phage terminase small subunit